MEDEGIGLRAADAAMIADQLLQRGRRCRRDNGVLMSQRSPALGKSMTRSTCQTRVSSEQAP